MNRIRTALGILLVVVGASCLWYSVRVARSQILYQRIKFRSPAITIADASQAAEQAYVRYPHNYHLSHWIAEKAWYEYEDRDLAWLWVRRGLEQNPYLLDLRWLETVLVGQTDPAEAARLWEQYSDAVFWNRWVLAGRVYWLAYAGRIVEAESYLKILRKEPGNYAWAEEALEAARGQ